MEAKGKDVVRNVEIGERQIQDEENLIKKSSMEISTAKFEDAKIARGIDFVTQEVTNGSQIESRGGKSSEKMCSAVMLKSKNGVSQIQDEENLIKKSSMEISTARFEDAKIARGIDFVTQEVTNGSQIESRGGKSSEKMGGVVMLKSRHVRGSSLDGNDFRSSLRDGSPRVNAVLRSATPGRIPTRVIGKGMVMQASPFWERKVSNSGNHGVISSLTPGRPQPRAIICGDASPDNSPTVPKFGDWDESNPSASEGFTKVFDQVREQRQNGGGTRTASSNGPSSHTRQKTFKTSEGCCCFRWMKR